MYKEEIMARSYIEAKDGYILTNGEIYGAVIFLAEGIDASTFHEITLEEYNQIVESNIEDELEVTSNI